MIWYTWTAFLAGMPYSVFDVMGPVIPGQLGMAPLSLVLIVLVAWRMLVPVIAEEFGGVVSGARGIFVRLGRAATVVLVLVEMYAVARGRNYLLVAWLVTLNTALVYVEVICSFLALLGWSLNAWEINQSERGEIFPCNVTFFALGGTAPALFMLLADTGGIWPAPIGLLSCIVVGVGAFFALRKFVPDGCLSFDCTLALLSGQLLFQIAKALVRELQFERALSWIPSKAVFAVYLLALTLFVCLLLIVRKRREPAINENKSQNTSSLRDEENESIDISPLLERAAKPLTERETSVLSMTLIGESSSRIAERLGLSKSTVATYRRRCCEKLGVGNFKELIALAEGCSCSRPDHILADVEAYESGQSVQFSSHRHRAFIACTFVAIIAIVFAQVPDNISFSGAWLHRLPSIYRWMICIALICSFLLCEKVEVTNAEASDVVSSAGSLLLACTLAAGAHCIWLRYGFCSQAVFVISLVLCSLAFGGPIRAESCNILTYLNALFHSLISGLDRLIVSKPYATIVAPSVLCLSDTVGYVLYLAPLPLILFLLLSLLTIILSSVLLVVFNFERKTDKVELEPAKECRALYYLQGRGLGELQARVMLDLMCGYRAKDICERHHVAASTVRSYRQRTFHALGIQSTSELRELLSCEAGVTTIPRLHRFV